jgi:hypothetical protein
MPLPNKVSFRLANKKDFVPEVHPSVTSIASTSANIPHNAVDDTRRRMFLKVLGGLGLGVAGATLLPQKTQALVMGGTPSTSVVGVKNIANERIDPAQETGGNLAIIASNTASLANIKTGTDFLSGIKTDTDKFTFTGNALQTVSSGVASTVGIKDASDNRITPVTDDTVVLLRRMVKLMESQAAVDSANRQRITVDAWGTGISLSTGAVGTALRVAFADNSALTTVSAVTNVVTIGSYATAQMFGDVAHGVYANAIRRNLAFS